MKTSIDRAILIAAALAFTLTAAGCSGRKEGSPDAARNYFKVDPATAGSISGKVVFEGAIPPAGRVDMDGDPQCARLHSTPVLDEAVAAKGDGRNNYLANVFVYVKSGLEDKKFEPVSNEVVIDQKGCWFGPRVLGVQTGQTLKVTNSDPLTHNIHPMPQVNREWNQSQAPGAEPFIRKFGKPEVMIRVKCNIHPWMHAWVGVVDHPYFAVTGADGAFTLPNLPPGSYTLEAWHEQLGRQEQQVTVAPSGRSESTFRFK